MSLVDTDDDDSAKTLFAFGASGDLMFQTVTTAGGKIAIDTSSTNGALIHSIEFDTEVGIAGGAMDGTYFTIDNFHVDVPEPCVAPSPSTMARTSTTIYVLDFNSGKDDVGSSFGELVFVSASGVVVRFTDDGSAGDLGGPVQGVHITNGNYGNIKVGSPVDFVLGAYSDYDSHGRNYHSSGIVARFSCGASRVSLVDTDDDDTAKTLFAFDAFGNLIGQMTFPAQGKVTIDVSSTNGVLIHSVEFDTEAGTAGGAMDGTYFTIDNFQAEFPEACTVPSPTPPSFTSVGPSQGPSQGPSPEPFAMMAATTTTRRMDDSTTTGRRQSFATIASTTGSDQASVVSLSIAPFVSCHVSILMLFLLCLSSFSA